MAPEDPLGFSGLKRLKFQKSNNKYEREVKDGKEWEESSLISSELLHIEPRNSPTALQSFQPLGCSSCFHYSKVKHAAPYLEHHGLLKKIPDGAFIKCQVREGISKKYLKVMSITGSC